MPITGRYVLWLSSKLMVHPRAKVAIDSYRKSYMRNRLVPKWTTLTFI